MATRVYVLTIEGVQNSSYRATTLHFQSAGTNDNDTVAGGESLLAAWDASCKVQFLATLPPTYALVRLTCRRVGLKPSATTCKYYGIGAEPGTRGADCAAQQTCPSVFLVPSMGTKSGGKIFWPSIPLGDIIQSVLQTAWKTAVDTVLATMIGGITSGGITWTLGVYSRKLNTIANIATHSYSPFVGFIGKRRRPVGAV